MPLAIGIVADDLTGALDAIGPFVALGIGAVVALDHADLAPALARTGVQAAAVSTESRHLSQAAAAKAVTRSARSMLSARPRILFKKIDSRLKGNVAAETAALLAVAGHRRVVAAPAVPELGRYVRSETITGAGVATPISIRAALAGLGVPVEIPDGMIGADLDEAARRVLAAPGEVLAVGARGLAAALAGRLARDAACLPPAAFVPAMPLVLAIGSRDPITAAQVAHLRSTRPDIAVLEAPDGEVAGPDPEGGVRLFLCTETDRPADAAETAGRFAHGVGRHIRRAGAGTIVASGGDTAAALLRQLGTGIVEPRGEAAPGVPWSTVAIPGNGPTMLITKSGGFGEPAALTDLIRQAEDAAMAERHD